MVIKKVIFALAAISLLTVISCKKTNTDNNGAGGSWTVNSVAYQSVVTTGNLYGNAGTLTAQNQTIATSSTSYDILVCSFFNALPTTSGTYVVVSNPVAANQIAFVADVNGIVTGTGYTSTGGNGNESVTVTVSGGKVSISGSGITMSIPATPSDSTTLSFNLKQTQ